MLALRRAAEAGGARRQRRAAFHRTHRKAGKVEIALGIHAGHFRRLAAHQRASRLAAAFGDAGDDAAGGVDFQPAGRVDDHVVVSVDGSFCQTVFYNLGHALFFRVAVNRDL